MAARKKTTRSKSREEAEFDVLFPYQTVELSNGEKVTVAQWNIDTGAMLTGRVISLIQKLQQAGRSNEEVELDELLAIAKDECVDIVSITIGMEREEFKRTVPFEDFLVLLQTVIDTSLVKEDGQGVLPKVLNLAGALAPLLGVQPPTSESARPSTSSSEPDTPSPMSGE